MRFALLALMVGFAGAAWADEPARPAAGSASPLKVVVANAVKSLPPASAPDTRGPSKRFVAQQEAMKALGFLDGEWRGAVKTLRKEGWTSLTQTVRSGVVLDGTLRMLEVKSFEADGSVSFEAVRIISFDPDKKTYAMRSYQRGAPHDVAMEASANGIAWTLESRGTSVRYETSVSNGAWAETATRTPKDGKAEAYLSVSMKRLRATSWPEGGAVAAK